MKTADEIEAQFQNMWYTELENVYRYQLGAPDWQDRLSARMRQDYSKKVQEIEDLFGSVFEKTLLDIGSGWGTFLIPAAKAGAKVVGVDIKKERVAITNRRLNVMKLSAQILLASGKDLPFADETFDIVTCFSVLEHVDEPNAVLNEIIRVLKRGGLFRMHVPNYCMPYDAHYGLWWISLLPKKVAKKYLSLRNRPNKYYDELTFTTYRSIISHLSKQNVKIIHLVEQKLNAKNYVRSPKKDFLASLIKLTATMRLFKAFVFPVSLAVVKQ